MDWIARHSIGWQYLVPGILLCAVALSVTLRSRRPGLAPWAVVVPWMAVVVACYLAFDIDRQWYGARAFWVAMTLTLAVVAAIPFTAMALLVWNRPVSGWSGYHAALITAVLGIGMIPVGSIVSGWIGRFVIPMVLPR